MAFGKLLQQSESHFSFLLAWTRINRGKNKRRKGYFYCRYDSQRGLQCYAADSMKGKVFDMFGRIYERRHSPMWRWNCCGKIIRQKCTEGFKLPAGSGQYIYTKTKMTSCQRLFLPWQEVFFFSCRSCRSRRPALDALFHSLNPFQHSP